MQRLAIQISFRFARVVLLCCAPCLAVGEEQTAKTGSSEARQASWELLSRYCTDCHGADTQEGNLRLDEFDFDKRSILTAKTLDKMLSVVSSGEMPPEDAELPTAKERKNLVSWLEGQLDQLVDELKPTLERSRNRRLTVEEYNYTMQDLFGIDAEFGDMLPPDPISSSGYRNATTRLGLSSLQIEAYLDSARRAIRRYVQSGDLLGPSLLYRIEFEDLYYATGDRYGTRERAPKPVATTRLAELRASSPVTAPKYVEPLGPKLPGAYSEEESMRAAIPKLNQQYVALRQRLPIGEMLVRVRAAGIADRKGRFPRMRVEAGITLGDGCSIDQRMLGEADVSAPLERPQTFEFRVRLEDVPTKGELDQKTYVDRLSVFDLDQIFISNMTCDSRAIFALGRGGYSDPEKGSKQIAKHLEQLGADHASLLHLDSIEIEMLPGVGAENAHYRWRLPQADEREEPLWARDFLERFMRSAYRRPVDSGEVANKLELLGKLRTQGYASQESLRETLAAVLVSPSFLFRDSRGPIKDESGRGGASRREITAHQLAARLSYLLWLSAPDERLTKLADDGSILLADVIRREVERMLEDPRSRRLADSFCRQWLRLDRHKSVAVDRTTYPAYDEDFAEDAINETLAFFHEVFTSDSSAFDLLDSDYAFLNDRLAEHYGIDTVTKGGLRRVTLPNDSVRGGLLTQASLLTMNSDGVDSHPIRRGVWLLDRLLHDPPPPPPPNVPPLEDVSLETSGLSLKERIALHRQPSACQSCHEKVDPWGIPFESFDAIGTWRQESVDSKTVLPDGKTVHDIKEFKRYLMDQHRRRFANAVVHHLLTYAIGRQPDLFDRGHVNEIRKQFSRGNYRMRSLVVAIVENPLFREP